MNDVFVESLYIPSLRHTVMNLEVENVEVEYIGGLFPKGRVSAVVAEGGIGKSWCLVGASLSITSNIPFLPREDYEIKDTGRVLIIDTEGRIKSFVKRIDLLGGSRNNYITPKNPLEIVTYNVSDDIELIEKIIESENIELLIVDSLSGFNIVDENTCQVLPCLQWFATIALKYNIAVVFTQLVNKSEIKDNKYTTRSVRGFSGIVQYPEIIWALDQPSPNKKIKRLYQIKNNIEQIDETNYIFKLENGSIEWQVDPNEYKNKSEVRKQIYDENVSLSNKDIADLIKAVEPDTKINTILQWITRQRN
jgi:RecA-family ATPase